MTSFVSRLMSKMMAENVEPSQEDSANQSSSWHVMEDVDEVWITPPVWAYRWRRLTIIAMITWVHSMTGSLIGHLEVMRNRLAEEALAAYRHRLGQPDAPPSKTPPPKPPQNVAERPMAKGKPMSRSTANKGKPFDLEPNVCNHPPGLMQTRGGQGGVKWYTCLLCGSRWERVYGPLTAKAPPEVPPCPTRAAPKAQATASSERATTETGSSRASTPPVDAATPPVSIPPEHLAALNQVYQHHHARSQIQGVVSGYYMTHEQILQIMLNACTTEEETQLMRAYIIAVQNLNTD